jgi:2-haloacid dehalogenase
MSVTLAFDVYGTLIDTHGIILQLQKFIGEDAKKFSQTWREKQLEYSFRQGLMKKYVDFSLCTSQALEYTCEYHNFLFSEEQKLFLLEYYRSLPVYEDVEDGLATLKSSGYRLFAFSNGNKNTIQRLLTSAGILDYFLDIVSVDAVKSFKPNPSVYNHFLTKSKSSSNNAWLISSNSFDVIGAISAGMNAAWVRRSPDIIFDPWGIDPTITVNNLSELNKELAYML